MTHVSTVNKLNYVEDSVLNDNYYFAQYLTMGALVNRRIGLMRTDRNAVQRAVLRAGAVVGTLVDCASDRHVAMGFIHEKDLLF